MNPSEPGSSSHSIASTVKDLMHRKQVPERQHAKKLGQILGLSYSQAHRKLKSGVGWTLEQLQVVALFFGESLASIGLVEVSAGSERPAGTMAEGLFVVSAGQHEYPCILWFGEQLHTARRADFVAYQQGDAWRVVETFQCPAGVVRHKINKLEIVLRQHQEPAVAILDDDHAAADNLRDFLIDNGFKATAFYSPTALERTVQEGTAFDGYIINWILGPRTAEGLIKQIRFSLNPAAPIFVLTEEASNNLADQDELARVILQLDVQVREKPVRLRTFTAELNKAIGC